MVVYSLEASSALSTLGTIFTQFMTWIGSLVTTIAGEPLLLLPVGIGIVGGAIGLTRRLIGK